MNQPSTPPAAKPDYLTLARELANETRTVVGVFCDPNFAGHEVPSSLRPEHFAEVWGARPDVRVVFLDAHQIDSYSLLFKGRMDILVFPYGSLYRMDCFDLYSSQTIAHFLGRGGALLTSGGIPFGTPTHPITAQPPRKSGTPQNPPLDDGTYEKWVAPLGIKYYVQPVTPAVTRADQRYLPGLAGVDDLAGCPLGIVVNNSTHAPVPKPPRGNVFPERVPARQVIPLLWGSDAYGATLAVNALLVQDFEDGSRRVHFAHETEPHPLSPGAAHFSALMDDLLRLLTNRLVAVDVAANYACYRQGEPVHLRAELASFEPAEADVDATLQIRGGGEVVYNSTRRLRVAPAERAVIEWEWAPERFEVDEYVIELSLARGGRLVSSTQNGFIVWDDEVARRGPALTLHNQYFRVGSSGESYISGTNYYESTRGEIMWFRPDVARVAADLRQMRENGVNYIRPHYHHLKWFRDYLLYHYGHMLDYYQELADLQDPLPDERVWRIWDMFIYLCQKYGIVYGGDLFTLVPEEMGDPRGWIWMDEALQCPDKRAVQKEFMRQINLRYKDVPGISWDLWNEPATGVEDLADWTTDLKAMQAALGLGDRLLTVGGAVPVGRSEVLANAVDYASPHMGTLHIKNMVNAYDKPVLVQETHLDRREDPSSEREQAEGLREGIIAAVHNGLAGVAPWSWTRQQRLWQDTYEHHHTFPMEKWDDRLGMNTHDDGTLKPAGQVFRDLGTLLRSMRLDRYERATGRVFSETGEVIARLAGDGASGHSLHHVSGERCFAGFGLGSVSWGGAVLIKGPADSYVYIFAPEDADLAAAGRVYAKSERAGPLHLSRTGAPRAVSLVDLSPLGTRTLEALEWLCDADGLLVETKSGQEAYWIAVDW